MMTRFRLHWHRLKKNLGRICLSKIYKKSHEYGTKNQTTYEAISGSNYCCPSVGSFLCSGCKERLAFLFVYRSSNDLGLWIRMMSFVSFHVSKPYLIALNSHALKSLMLESVQNGGSFAFFWCFGVSIFWLESTIRFFMMLDTYARYEQKSVEQLKKKYPFWTHQSVLYRSLIEWKWFKCLMLFRYWCHKGINRMLLYRRRTTFDKTKKSS